MKTRFPLIVGACFFALSANAAGDEMRVADAHVHGQGELFLELSGNILTFQLSAPKANFTQADGSLATAGTLPPEHDILAFPEAAGCDATELSLEIHADEPTDAETAGEEEAGHDGHADYVLTGSWNCRKPEKAGTIDLTFLRTFTGFESVKLIFLDGDDMLAKTATAESSKVSRR